MTLRDRIPAVSWLVWAFFALAFTSFLLLDALAHQVFGCELIVGSSMFGDPSWSPHRLGGTCTYLIVDRDYVIRPSALRPAIAVGLAAWAWSLRRSVQAPARLAPGDARLS